MREATSNTAELSAHLGGRRIIDDGVRQRMAEVLREIREGRFARELSAEESGGYPRLNDARDKARAAAIEEAFESLRKSEA